MSDVPNKKLEILSIRLTTHGKRHAPRLISKEKGVATVACLFEEHAQLVRLKLGVYRWNEDGSAIDYKSPAISDPRSEVKLSPEATTRLVNFLSENFEPLKTGASKFINLDDWQGEISDILELVIQKHKQGLVESDFILALELHERQAALNEMASRLGENLPEKDWQSWFQNHDWIIGGQQAIVLDERRIDLAHTGDFHIKSEDMYLDIVEIKLPSTQFWRPSKDRDNLVVSSEVMMAVTQGINYCFAWEKQIDSLAARDRMHVGIARPGVLVVIGRSNEWNNEHFLAQRLFNSTLHGIRVITYDQLLTRARQMLPKTE